MGLRIGRIQLDGRIRRAHGALQQWLLLLLFREIVGIYRQRFGRQRLSFGGSQRFAQIGSLNVLPLEKAARAASMDSAAALAKRNA